MRTRNVIFTAALGTGALVLSLGACRSDELSNGEDFLPAVGEMELVTPTEAADLARERITPANVDAEYAKLVAELDAETR